MQRAYNGRTVQTLVHAGAFWNMSYRYTFMVLYGEGVGVGPVRYTVNCVHYVPSQKFKQPKNMLQRDVRSRKEPRTL